MRQSPSAYEWSIPNDQFEFLLAFEFFSKHFPQLQTRVSIKYFSNSKATTERGLIRWSCNSVFGNDWNCEDYSHVGECACYGRCLVCLSMKFALWTARDINNLLCSVDRWTVLCWRRFWGYVGNANPLPLQNVWKHLSRSSRIGIVVIWYVHSTTLHLEMLTF